MRVLCMTEVSHLTETRVIQGEKLEQGNWIHIQEEVVPVNTTLRAGSIVEKTQAQAQVGIRGGWYAPVSNPPHTHLDGVFVETVPFAKATVTLANVLRAYGFKSLEQIVDNAEGREPFTDGKQKGGIPVHAHDLLLRYLPQADVDRHLAEARKAIDGTNAN